MVKADNSTEIVADKMQGSQIDRCNVRSSQRLVATQAPDAEPVSVPGHL